VAEADRAGDDDAGVAESLPAVLVVAVESPHAARHTQTRLIDAIFLGELVTIAPSLVRFVPIVAPLSLRMSTSTARAILSG
jgi:hypothetical protein